MPRAVITTLILPAALTAAPCWGLSGEAREFIELSRKLEPLQCERRKLRREIALAQAEQRDARALTERFAALDRDPKTAPLEKRLAELAPRVRRSPDPEDLAAISRQHTEAFYRCE
jgi:hypothetical protein